MDQTMQHDAINAAIPTGGRFVNITVGRNDLANLQAVKADLERHVGFAWPQRLSVSSSFGQA
jgi:hypothetical protein